MEKESVVSSKVDVAVLTDLSRNLGEIHPTEFEEILGCLRSNKKYRSIDLRGNKLGVEGAKRLAEALKLNTTLKSLCLQMNEISDDGTLSLVEMLLINTGIENVNLVNNRIGDRGAKGFVRVLLKNKTLKKLSLKHNFIYDDTAKEIAEALKSNSTLLSLDLSENDLSVNTVRIFIKMLKTNTTLTSLVFNAKFARDDELMNELTYYIGRNKSYRKQHDELLPLFSRVRDLLQQPMSEQNTNDINACFYTIDENYQLLQKVGYGRCSELLDNILEIKARHFIRQNRFLEASEAIDHIKELSVFNLKVEMSEKILACDLVESDIITQNEQRQLVLIFLRSIDNIQGIRIKLNMLAILQEHHGLLGDMTLERLLNVDEVLTIEQLNNMDIAAIEGRRIAIYEQMCVFPKTVSVFHVVHGRLEPENPNQADAVFDQANILTIFDHFKNDTLRKLDRHFMSSKSVCNLQ